jgi:hypothetical protein
MDSADKLNEEILLDGLDTNIDNTIKKINKISKLKILNEEPQPIMHGILK